MLEICCLTTNTKDSTMKKLILILALCLISTIAYANDKDLCAERIKEKYGAIIIKSSGIDMLDGCNKYAQSQGKQQLDKNTQLTIFKSIEANKVTHYACLVDYNENAILLSPIKSNYYQKFSGTQACLAMVDVVTLLKSVNMYADDDSLSINRKNNISKKTNKTTSKQRKNTSNIGKTTSM